MVFKSIDMEVGKQYKCVEVPQNFSHYIGVVVEATDYKMGEARYCNYVKGGNVVLDPGIPYCFAENFKFEEIE